MLRFDTVEGTNAKNEGILECMCVRAILFLFLKLVRLSQDLTKISPPQHLGHQKGCDFHEMYDKFKV